MVFFISRISTLSFSWFLVLWSSLEGIQWVTQCVGKQVDSCLKTGFEIIWGTGRWTVPYRPAKSILVYEWKFQDTLIETGKNKSAQWSILHVVCPHVWAFTNLREVVNGPTLWLGRRRAENGPKKEMPIWGTALWKFMGIYKVGHVDAHLNLLSILEGDWNWQADRPICSLKVATWVYKIGGHWGSTAVQR